MSAGAKEDDRSLNTDSTVSPYAVNVTYLETYYPHLVKEWKAKCPKVLTDVLPFQELLRTLIAERLASDRVVSDDGQSSIRIIKIMLKDRRATLPAEFVAVADAEIKSAEAVMAADKKAKVRPMVRTILAWPQAQNLGDFVPFPAAQEAAILAEVKRVCPVIKGASLAPGKIGETVKVNVPGLAKTLWSDKRLARLLTEALPGVKFRINHENSHVTLVNSGVIKATNKDSSRRYDAVMRALSFLNLDDLEVEYVKHTFSMDFAPFGFCLVVGLKSRMLTEVVKAINGEFELDPPVAPKLHVTVATTERFDRPIETELAGGASVADVKATGDTVAVVNGVSTTGDVVVTAIGAPGGGNTRVESSHVVAKNHSVVAVGAGVTPEFLQQVMAMRAARRG